MPLRLTTSQLLARLDQLRMCLDPETEADGLLAQIRTQLLDDCETATQYREAVRRLLQPSPARGSASSGARRAGSLPRRRGF